MFACLQLEQQKYYTSFLINNLWALLDPRPPVALVLYGVGQRSPNFFGRAPPVTSRPSSRTPSHIYQYMWKYTETYISYISTYMNLDMAYI